MGLLALLGFFFYGFAKQERSNAEYYAEAAKNRRPDLPAEVLFDWGMRHLITGPMPNEYNSALWGGRGAILPTMFGRDLEPFSGPGFNIIEDATTFEAKVDFDYDGDGNGTGEGTFQISDTVGVSGGDVSNVDFTIYPDIDASYTYPDGNNLFLAYNGYTVDGNGYPIRVIIPSFHRPQYLRQSGGAYFPSVDNGSVYAWDKNTNTVRRVLRPHEEHYFVHPNGTAGGRRFVRDASEALQAGLSEPFPFTNIRAADPDLTKLRQGIWDAGPWVAGVAHALGDWVVPSPTSAAFGAMFFECTAAGTSGGTEPQWASLATSIGSTVTDGGVTWTRRLPNPTYEFDADPDGDNVKEAVWVDLGYPIQQSGNIFFVPMFAYTVYDADSLLNANVHGNIAALVAGTTSVNDGQAFGGDSDSNSVVDFLSKSNQGLSAPSQINPQYALNGNPFNYQINNTGTAQTDLPSSMTGAEAFEQHLNFHNRTLAQLTVPEIANMEFYWMLVGRPGYQSSGSVSDLYAGRWGELPLLGAFAVGSGTVLPRAGQTFTGSNQGAADDNNSRFEGQLAGRTPFVHPLDYVGAGIVSQNLGGLWQASLIPDGLSGLNQWPGYVYYSDNWVSGTNTPVTWSTATASASLTQNSLSLSLLDDPEETIVEPRYSQTTDDIFSASEMFALHGSSTDRTNTGASSRLMKLMPWNLDTNSRAGDIRKRFTTDSWDLNAHGRFWPGPSTANNGMLRPGEFVQYGSPAVTNSDGQPAYRFPPTLFADTDTANEDAAEELTEPFRRPVRQLLRVVANRKDAVNLYGHRRLSLNHLTSFVDPRDSSTPVTLRKLTDHPADPGASPLSTVFSTLDYTDPTTFPTYPTTNAQEQEWWARYDRQLMARDIYTMLYLFCGPRDDIDYLTEDNSARGVYTDKQLEQMAQFAVNLVDQLDPDDVITAFEYDKNLSNGWNLNDDPFDQVTAGSFNEVDAERGVVYGVEAQRLTFSELLVVKTLQVLDENSNPYNHPVTMHDDRADRYFSFIELRNASPFPVDFTNKEEWMIEMEWDNGDGDPDTNPKRELTFRAAAPQVPAGGLLTILSADSADTNRDIANGSAQDSYVRFDLSLDDTQSMTAQAVYDTGSFPDQLVQSVTGSVLDLIMDAANSTNSYTLQDTNITGTASGGLIDAAFDSTIGGVQGVTIQFHLKRRAHLTRSSVTNDDDNPWVEVDHVEIKPGEGIGAQLQIAKTNDPNTTDSGAEIQTKLTSTMKQQGLERIQPLARDDEDGSGTADSYLGVVNNDLPVANPINQIDYNTIGADNFSTTDTTTNQSGKFDLWQPHFDRDFSSAMEVLSIPLYGPEDLTRALDLKGTFTAGVKRFLDVSRPNQTGPSAAFDGDPDWLSTNENREGNRWYRLFSFAEVPSRAGRQALLWNEDINHNGELDTGEDVNGNGLLDTLGWYRQPGKLNLNTIRYPEVLAGLIDDLNVMGYDSNSDGTVDTQIQPLFPGTAQTWYLPDSLEGTARDWWGQFVASRDGKDAVTGLFLPGMAGSRPFRDFSDLGPATVTLSQVTKNDPTDPSKANPLDPLSHTLLRGLHADFASGNSNQQQDPRHLFELGTWLQHEAVGNASSSNVPVDHYTRNRLLSKVAGNTTTRSNVFYVFIEVQFFEAAFDGNGNIRIGGKLEDSARHRGFFVVDRSLAMEQITAAQIRPRGANQPFSIISKTENPVTGFDHNAVILHRQIIE